MFDYIQGDIYVQADVSVEDNEFPLVSGYERAKVCVCERETERGNDRENKYWHLC